MLSLEEERPLGISNIENMKNVAMAENPWVLRRLLQEHASGVRPAILASAINSIILFAVFWGSYPPADFLAAGLFMAVLLTWRHLLSRAILKARNDAKLLFRLRMHVETNAAALGLWWGISVVICMFESTPEQQVLCAIVGSGMMAGAAHTYRTVRKAAYYFVGFSGAGCAVALISQNNIVSYAGTILICGYVYIMFSGIKLTEANILVRHQREMDLRESAETINLLLADFTEQGSDLVIEMDADGKLVRPTDQLAAAARRPIETLDGKPIIELFDHGPERDALIGIIAANRPFRNHQISLSIGKERLWWSINARPVAENGQYRGIVSDITAQRQAEEQVSYMAHFDALTDLPNRFQFNQRLSWLAHRDQCRLGLMYLDLDQFKIINDTLGHGFGDLLLKGVARRLESCISGEETVARLGGDEFAILFKSDDLEYIKSVGDTIIKALSIAFRLDDHDVIVSTSIGIAIAPLHGDDASTLLRNADLALYEAKSQGRNRQVVFEIGMDESAQLRRALELDLRGALGKQELCLHYQPLVRIEDGETLGYEALIRWEHPERGVVMPDAFIPIAEESGMIIPIGEWVIRQAMDDLLEWPSHMTVSINLSPVQMRSPSLITTLIQKLASTGLDPKRICLEITETVLMQDSEANLATLHKLHEIGVEIALDDFGTGYSSLNYLRSFPFDKIKIDRCFVDEIDTREDCQAIVRSVVNLANSLGMTTTAEGVEREDQVEHLRREGCLNVQGYLFSKAVPQDQLTDLRKPIYSHAQRLVVMETQRKIKAEAILESKSIKDKKKSAGKAA
jgi:diguanylate cyclase (GGDEF)-like protein